MVRPERFERETVMRKPGGRSSRPSHLKVVVGPDVGQAVPPGGDEADLLARVARQDGAAMRILVDRHLPVLVASVGHVLADRSEAEDIAQETFVRFWRSASTLHVGEAGVLPWLRRVARNLAIDRLRARKRLDVMDEVPEVATPPEQLQSLEAADRQSRIEQAMANLPERQRLALVLFHFDELSQIEISEMLDISVDAVESLLARARRTLKRDLEHDWRGLVASEESGAGFTVE